MRKPSNRIGSKKTALAKSFRREPSKGEEIMWKALRRDQLGKRFRRQHPVGKYVLDFYCSEALVAVEVDGGFHEEARDRTRDEALLKLGIRTLRIKSETVFDEQALSWFLTKVYNAIHGLD